MATSNTGSIEPWTRGSAPLSTDVETVVSVRGRARRASALEVDGRTIVVDGGWLKMAHVQDEEVAENAAIDNPGDFRNTLQRANLKADLFSFRQRLTDPSPRLTTAFEWNNLAVIPITSYSDWWDKRLSQDTRRNVRRAEKRGVVLREVSYTDEFVRGIKRIYDETPMRQGRPFWHYGKPLQAVKEENGTYLERSDFIGAYFGDELIGFIKLIYVDGAASIIQILAQNQHYDKRPANALIAKAVEIAAAKAKSHLIYCNYTYGRGNNSPLTEFKRRNGFEKLCVPQYYLPLTQRGKVAMDFGLHRGIREVLPDRLVTPLLKLRAKYYALRAGTAREIAHTEAAAS